MPHHDPVIITIKVGTEIEGITLSAALRELLMPGLDDTQTADKVKDYLYDRLRMDITNALTPMAVEEYINENVSESN